MLPTHPLHASLFRPFLLLFLNYSRTGARRIHENYGIAHEILANQKGIGAAGGMFWAANED